MSGQARQLSDTAGQLKLLVARFSASDAVAIAPPPSTIPLRRAA
jgi:hypothetical protein